MAVYPSVLRGPELERRRRLQQKPGLTSLMAGGAGRALPPDQPAPTWPNPGTYDPTFKINVGSAQRGYDYGVEDFTRDWGSFGAEANMSGQQIAADPSRAFASRNQADLATVLSRQGRQDEWQGEDFGLARQGIERTTGRSLTDLLTNRTRGSEDYERSITGLRRDYGRLGDSQAQKMRAAGVAQGGAAAQAARKRRENFAWDRAPVDTNFSRFWADSHTGESRLNEDKSLALRGVDRSEDRYKQQSGWRRDDALQGYDRARTDAITGQGRNFIENEQYGKDMAALAYASSGQVQPQPLTGAQQAVQGLVIRGDKRYRRLSNGELAPVDQWGRLIR